MITFNPTYSQNQNNLSFQSTSKEARLLYKSLDKEFVQIAKDSGITQGLIVCVIDRLRLMPNFEKFSISDLMFELSKRFKTILTELNNPEGIDVLARRYCLEPVAQKALKNKQIKLNKIDYINELYDKGLGIVKISKAVGLCPETVRRTLLKRGINLTQKRYERDLEIISLLKEGFSDAKISKRLGIRKEKVYSIRKEYDLPSNPDDFREVREAQIAERLLQGVSKKDVQKEFNLSRGVIDPIATKYNVYSTLKKARDEKIVNLYKIGTPMSVLADELKLSIETIKRIIKGS